MSAVAVYIHVPFCPSKCGYCDFNSYAMQGSIVERTVEAICSELRASPWKGRAAKTIFFGGGTPTFLEEGQLLRILEAVMEVHPPIPGAEITSEANPGTVDIPKFSGMYRAGFNRISLGAQSFVREDLIRLGRVHQSDEIGKAVAAAREAGFKNINIDLMFALPGQSLHAWKQNLEFAMLLHTEHLSLYCLTIEPSTRFYRLHGRGMLDLPDDSLQVKMYNLALEVTKEHGFQQYEISNFAKPGYECRHNLCYWYGEEYLGYGPGAVGCFEVENPHEPATRRMRYVNTKHPVHYCSKVEARQNLWCESEILDEQTLNTEKIMLGIRLNQGLNARDLRLNPEGIQKLLEKEWICYDSAQVLKLTPKGRHFCNQVVLELI
jgi:oxygen-independent coproporphyrinogen-3 oxidase